MRLPNPLDFNLADCLADPFRCLRLRGAKEDFRCRLRQHGLCIFAVTRLHLAASLEPKNDRILRFPVLGDGRVKLRETLQAGQLIDDKPDRLLIGHRLIQEPQNQRIDPQADERAQCFAHRRS